VRVTDDGLDHGSTSTYTNHECRCSACRTAWADYCDALKHTRERRLARDPDVVPHGRASTYSNWRCRCPECTEAWRVDAKRRREAS
jgi:hypothetical protein